MKRKGTLLAGALAAMVASSGAQAEWWGCTFDAWPGWMWASPLQGAFTVSTGEEAYTRMMGDSEELAELADRAFVGEDGERVLALEAMMAMHPEAAMNMAQVLVRSRDGEVALWSAEALDTWLGMQSGRRLTGEEMVAMGPWTLASQTTAQLTLFQAIGHPEEKVRAVAALAVLGAGVPSGIAKIEDCVKRGVMSEAEAVSYYASSYNEDAREMLWEYVEAGSPEVRVAALGVLATDPKAQGKVRKMLQDESGVIPVEMQVRAAEMLGRYDNLFPHYGLRLLDEPWLEDPVKDAIERVYLERISRNIERTVHGIVRKGQTIERVDKSGASPADLERLGRMGRRIQSKLAEAGAVLTGMGKAEYGRKPCQRGAALKDGTTEVRELQRGTSSLAEGRKPCQVGPAIKRGEKMQGVQWKMDDAFQSMSKALKVVQATSRDMVKAAESGGPGIGREQGRKPCQTGAALKGGETVTIRSQGAQVGGGEGDAGTRGRIPCQVGAAIKG